MMGVNFKRGDIMPNQGKDSYTGLQLSELLNLKTPLVKSNPVDRLVMVEHCLKSNIDQEEKYQTCDAFELNPHEITRLILLKLICSNTNNAMHIYVHSMTRDILLWSAISAVEYEKSCINRDEVRL